MTKSKEELAEEFTKREHLNIFGSFDLVHPSATKAIFLAGYEAGRADALEEIGQQDYKNLREAYASSSSNESFHRKMHDLYKEAFAKSGEVKT
jgi:hypothetical protein